MRYVPRLLAAALLIGLATAGHAAPPQGLSHRDAQSLDRKIDVILQRGIIPSRTVSRTVVTESEVNSYLSVYGRDQLPTGVLNPRVSILGGDKVSARAVVDLDAVRRASSGGWFDPASYVGGKVPVFAQGVLKTRDGVARFELESAQAAGITIPKALLQQVVTYYTRSSDYPHGVGLDDPFPLPARIRQIEMRRGEAVVVQ